MKFVLNQITGKLDQVELNNMSDADAATLTDDSMADTLHRHSELSASDGIPDRALIVDTLGNVGIGMTGPNYPLQIGSGSDIPDLASGLALYISNDAAINYGRSNIVLRNSSDHVEIAFGAWSVAFFGTRTNHDIYFQTKGINYMSLSKSGGLALGSAYTGIGVNNGNAIISGNVGIGTSTPTAVLHLKAGTATAGTAPLKFTVSGAVVLTTPEVGVIEPNAADDIFYTITTGVARKGIVLNDGANLTSGKIPIASTNGRLIDGPTPLAGTKVYYVSDTSGGVTNRKLTFVDGILTAET
ncbi:MAG: hypothetical protein ABIJ40_18695 [Bacteroidota bacterium]